MRKQQSSEVFRCLMRCGHHRRWRRVNRPGQPPVDPKEEAERVVPVVRELLRLELLFPLIRAMPRWHVCVVWGAIINDVSGFTDPEMVKVAAILSAVAS